jgi:arginyl-tRNA synthetase
VFNDLKIKFNNYIKENFTLVSYHLLLNTDSNKKDFGDLNSNIAMQLAKVLKKNPNSVAQEIVLNFKHESLEKIEIAGPGFLNFFLKEISFKDLAITVLKEQESAFKTEHKSQKISLEFVSANPTGPLHIGHGRGAIIGDVLANIWIFLGHQVTKEYYINDAGAQIGKLGRSLKVRIEQQQGLDSVLQEDAYHGEYLIDLAIEYLEKYNNLDDNLITNFAKEKLLELICQTLSEYGIDFDVWFSEQSLHSSGVIQKSIEKLTNKNHTFEHEGSLWFRSTTFGDDKDRVIVKQNGELTYVAADIAYMQNKIDRGADRLVMILGHDHHSYVTRLKALQQAMGLEKYQFDIILYQLVKIQKGGERVRMSKRSGNSIMLQDVIATIGKDAARFFYLNRKADADLDLDLDLALQKSESNPVFYVQYACVRIKSVLERAEQFSFLLDINQVDIANLDVSIINEKELIKKMYQLQELLEQIAENFQTHLLAYYTIELAHCLHSYYSKNRIINPADIIGTRMRIGVLKTCKIAFETAFKLLGISCPDKM